MHDNKSDFDPYHRWLGIPPDERPISKYRLLALADFEGDPEVINAAAEGRTVFLRTMQAGQHANLVAQLLNEISQARVTLLDPHKKSAYDAQLRNERTPKQAQPTPAPAPVVQPAAPAVNLPTPPPSGTRNVTPHRKRTGSKRIWKRPEVIGLSTAGCLLILIIVFWKGGSNEAPIAVTSPQALPTGQPQQEPEPISKPTSRLQLERAAEPKPTPEPKTKPEAEAKPTIERELQTRVKKVHQGGIRDIAVSRESTLAASASDDESVNIWNYDSLQSVMQFPHPTGVQAVDFSPDGERLATASYDGVVRMWDLATNGYLFNLSGHVGNCKDLSFHPSGTILASVGFDNTVRIWDLNKRKEKWIFDRHTDRVDCVSFSPDGEIVASGSYDKTIKLWNVSSGKELGTLEGHETAILCLDFDPSGRMLASGSGDLPGKGRCVKVWDLKTRTEKFTFSDHNANIDCIAFSPNGELLATAGGVELFIYETENGRLVDRLQEFDSYYLSLAFSKDGTSLLSGDGDGTLRKYSLKQHVEKRDYASETWAIASKLFDAGCSLVLQKNDGSRVPLTNENYADMERDKDRHRIFQVWFSDTNAEMSNLLEGQLVDVIGYNVTNDIQDRFFDVLNHERKLPITRALTLDGVPKESQLNIKSRSIKYLRATDLSVDWLLSQHFPALDYLDLLPGPNLPKLKELKISIPTIKTITLDLNLVSPEYIAAIEEYDFEGLRIDGRVFRGTDEFLRRKMEILAKESFFQSKLKWLTVLNFDSLETDQMIFDTLLKADTALEGLVFNKRSENFLRSQYSSFLENLILKAY